MDLTTRFRGTTDVVDGNSDDATLLSHVGRGHRDALEHLYRRHGGSILRFLRQVCGSPELAEEVLQETLLAVWKGASRFRAEASAQTWIFGIARRQAHTAMRRKRLEMVSDDALGDVSDADLGPADLAIASATRDALNRALSKLSIAHREVIVLALVEGLQYGEVARITGVPVGTVRSRLNHARLAMRALLDEAEMGPNSDRLP